MELDGGDASRQGAGCMSFKRRAMGSRTRLLTPEQLEIWLASLDPPAPNVSTIDGFLAAIVVSPRFIQRDRWMRSILGDRVRHVLEGTRMAAAQRTIIERYHQVCDELAECPEIYAPVFMLTDDGEVILEDWANGFFAGMNMAIDAWAPFVSDPEIGYPLATIVGHSSQTGGPTWIEQLNDPQATQLLADAWRIVPDIVSMLHDRCTEARIATMC